MKLNIKKSCIITLIFMLLMFGNLITVNAQTIPQSQITVESVSGSYDAAKFPPSNVLDGVRDNFWTSAKGLPQHIILNLGKNYMLSKLNIVPSQYMDIDDSILEYNIYVSTDGVSYKSAASGTWEDDPTIRADKSIELNNVEAKYIKFEAVKAMRDYLVISDMSVEGVEVTEEPITNRIDIIKPTSRQIIQRNDRNTGTVNVTGTYSINDTVDSIEMCAVLDENALGGEEVPWTAVTSYGDGNYTGNIELKAGGWYTIKVRAKYNNEYCEAQIEKVGIGDIFLTAGQSNSASFGQQKTTPDNDTVSTWNPNNDTWVFAADPQISWDGSFIQYTHTNGQNTGGSPWPTLGDYLTEKYHVPIGFISAGWGSSKVSDFLPNSAQGHYTRLKTPLQHFGVNGIKAVLWHQGESDAIDGTTAEQYKSDLLTVINESRKDAGYDIPWIIATASYHTDPRATEDNEKKIVEGQIAACNEINILQGPNTNDMLTGYRSSYDNVHFNETGLIEHGTRWGKVLSEKLYHGTTDLYIANTNLERKDNSVTVSFKINNVSSEKQSFNAYIALYDEDELVSMKAIKTTDLDTDQYADINETFADMDAKISYSAKVFVWSDSEQIPNINFIKLM